MRNSKETFIASGHRAKFEELSQLPAFEAACQSALLSIMEECPEKFRDMSDSWQTGVYLSGARRLVEVLSTIYKVEKPPEKQKPKTLNYD